MNFDLDDADRATASAARDFYRAHAPAGAARAALEGGAVLPGRKALAGVGFLGIIVGEAAGGAGGSLLQLALVAEQGGAVLAGPSLSTAARAAVLLAGHDDLAAQLADGSTAFSVLDGPVTGSAPSVDAADATMFLAMDGDALVVGRGVVQVGAPIDATRGLASVQLTESRVLARDAGDVWTRARAVAVAVIAAEDLGAADHAVQASVAYAKQRQAFGRFVGSYQAIKHLLVDAWVGVDQLRSLVWWAAWAADQSPGELPLAAAAAKAQAAVALECAAETMIQVFGGIGFTWEHDAHLYWRRAKVDRLVLGDEAEHLDAVARIAVSGGWAT